LATIAIGQPNTERTRRDPDASDGGGDGADGACLGACCRATVFGQDGGRISRITRRIPSGTRMTSSRYPRTGIKSGNEIEGGGGVTGDEDRQGLRIPRLTWTATGKIERMHVQPLRFGIVATSQRCPRCPGVGKVG